MNILPGFESSFTSNMSSTQVISYAVEHYLLIGLYVFLFVLVNLNVWIIIIRQNRYKNSPLLAFYVFA